MPGQNGQYDENRLSPLLLARFAFLLVPLNAVILPIFLYVPTFYAQEQGVGLGLIGGLIFLSRLFDAVSDPTVGILSDHTRSRFGRRKPWIAVGAGVAAPCLLQSLRAAGRRGGDASDCLADAVLSWLDE